MILFFAKAARRSSSFGKSGAIQLRKFPTKGLSGIFLKWGGMGCIQLFPKSLAERSTRGPSSAHAIQPSGRQPPPTLYSYQQRVWGGFRASSLQKGPLLPHLTLLWLQIWRMSLGDPITDSWESTTTHSFLAPASPFGSFVSYTLC